MFGIPAVWSLLNRFGSISFIFRQHNRNKLVKFTATRRRFGGFSLQILQVKLVHRNSLPIWSLTKTHGSSLRLNGMWAGQLHGLEMAALKSQGYYFNGTLASISWWYNLMKVSSICGYDTKASEISYNRQRAKANNGHSSSKKAWEWWAPYDFHECLAHADITFVVSMGEIKHVVGMLEHTQGCAEAVLTRLSAIPLHPHVVEVVLAQLLDGARFVCHYIQNTWVIYEGYSGFQRDHCPNEKCALIARWLFLTPCPWIIDTRSLDQIFLPYTDNTTVSMAWMYH